MVEVNVIMGAGMDSLVVDKVEVNVIMWVPAYIR